MQNFLSEMTSHAIFQKIRYFLIIDPAARSNDAFKMRGIRDPKKRDNCLQHFKFKMISIAKKNHNA